MAVIDLNDATPAAPANQANVRWQADTEKAPRHVSAYVPQFSETPSGTIDASNVTYTLSQSPLSSSLLVLLNGVALLLGTDFTLDGSSLTLTEPPRDGDWLLASYLY